MVQFLIVIHTLVSLLLIGVILMQSGQGGLNSMMGGSAATSMLGSSGANDFITKLTTWLGITFIGLALLIGFLSGGDSIESTTSGDSTTSQESLLQKKQKKSEGENLVIPEYSLPSEDPIPEEAIN